MSKSCKGRKFYDDPRVFAALYPCALDYLEIQKEKGYTKSTLLAEKDFLANFGRAMEARNLVLDDLDEKIAEEIAREAGGFKFGRLKHKAKRLITYLRDNGLCRPPPPLSPEELEKEELKEKFHQYLRKQRGLQESTIEGAWNTARKFLDFHSAGSVSGLSALRPIDVTRYLEWYSTKGKVPGRCAKHPGQLRSFFYFLFYVEITQLNLAPVIPCITYKYAVQTPRYLSQENVEKLLESVRANPAKRSGKRDFAMIIVLARLGLRGPEVMKMTLDDIDWRAGELLVHGKGRQKDKMPIPQDVGLALARYIQEERPQADTRKVFLSCIAPHPPLVKTQTLNSILRGALNRAGLKPPTRYTGTHLLRHSLATSLVNKGVPLREISDVLRHRSPTSTMRYAKLDVEGLRSLAQPWPLSEGEQ
jgi:site-specific recombinase XerD